MLSMTGRILIMLVVMTAMVATRQPAAAAPAPASPEARTVRASWIDRLQVGLSKSITRSALLQRIAFDQPRPPLTHRVEFTTRPVRQELPSPYRFCLPPPAC